MTTFQIPALAALTLTWRQASDFWSTKIKEVTPLLIFKERMKTKFVTAEVAFYLPDW